MKNIEKEEQKQKQKGKKEKNKYMPLHIKEKRQ
jgi:hypothetical protein